MIPSNDFNAFDSPSGFESLSWSQAWIKALTSPSVDTYTRIAHDPQASIWRAATWLFVATLIGSLIAAPLSLLFNSAQLEQLQQLIGDAGGESWIGLIGLLVCLTPLGAVFAVLGGMIGAGIYQLVAGLLGGRGNFTEMFMAMSAYTSPMTIVSSIASAIPLVNLCIGIPLAIYNIVLSVIAVEAINRFGWGKAVFTVLLPVVVVFSCCCLAGVALFSLTGAALGDPTNWQQFLTPAP